MKKSFFLFSISVLLLSLPVIAQEKVKEENKKVDLKFYGFIKGDLAYTTDEVKSFANVGSLAAPQVATGVDRSAVGFTAQHTRIGLKGSVGEEVKVGGVVEIDFFTGTFVSNANPRLRLGYASVTKGGFEARMGQQWDLFSPLNPNTNNTNGNLWYAGNRGFRRAQLQLSYQIASEKFSPMLQFSLGETTPDGAFPGVDNLSGVPMIQARLSGKILNKYTVGASFVNGSYLYIYTPTTTDYKYSTSGISVDVNLPLHKYFALNGEFSTGTNLANATLFSIAGSYVPTVDANGLVENYTKSMGYWVNASSNVTSWLTFVLGYGMDKNATENLGNGATESNSVLFTHFIFPIKHGFSCAFEYQNINTAIKAEDTRKANVIGLSAKLAF
jgi:hypothetical protein